MVTPPTAFAVPANVAWPAPRTAMGVAAGRWRRRILMRADTSAVEVGFAVAMEWTSRAAALKYWVSLSANSGEPGKWRIFRPWN